MQQGYSIKNIWRNMTRRQKIGAGLFLVIIVLLIAFLAVLANDFVQTQNNGEDGGEQAEEVEETYTDDRGVTFTVTEEEVVEGDGETIISGTKMDEYGNVTTIDPNLITTYIPYQVMREHNGWVSTLRYALSFNEDNAFVIDASIEFCDEENDKALVQQYLDSIPVDLSGYTINYEPFSEDAICEYEVSFE